MTRSIIRNTSEGFNAKIEEVYNHISKLVGMPDSSEWTKKYILQDFKVS